MNSSYKVHTTYSVSGPIAIILVIILLIVVAVIGYYVTKAIKSGKFLKPKDDNSKDEVTEELDENNQEEVVQEELPSAPLTSENIDQVSDDNYVAPSFDDNALNTEVNPTLDSIMRPEVNPVVNESIDNNMFAQPNVVPQPEVTPVEQPSMQQPVMQTQQPINEPGMQVPSNDMIGNNNTLFGQNTMGNNLFGQPSMAPQQEMQVQQPVNTPDVNPTLEQQIMQPEVNPTVNALETEQIPEQQDSNNNN